MFQLRTPNIVPLSDHVWLLDDNHEATCYVVAGTKQAAVIDTSVGLSNIREAAESLTSLPLICINTHGHGDHMGGNWSFDKAYMNPADLPIAEACLNDPEVREWIRQNDLSYPPFEPVEDGHVFNLGGVELEVIYLPGHTPGEIVLLDRRDRMLFAGDGINQHLWLQLDESLPVSTQIRSMERLLPLRNTFDFVLNGHIQTPYDVELFDTLLEALKDLEAGNTADDIDYEWFGHVSKAHPFQPEDRRIVYKDQPSGGSE